MNQLRRNFALDGGLVVLLVVNLFTHEGGGAGSSFGAELMGHLHIVTGIGLMLASLVHIVLHLPWFRAVVTGKVNGRIKLFMYSMVTAFFILAFFTGLAADASTAAFRLHGLAGSLVVVGLTIHIIKHARWMVFAGKKLITRRREDTSSAI